MIWDFLVVGLVSCGVGYFVGLWSCYWWCRGVINWQERTIEELTDANFRH